MADQKITSPLLTIFREGDDEPIIVQTDNRDLVLWDKTRARHKWPPIQEGAFIWLTFIGWAAARRNGLIEPDVTYEKWEGTVVDISSEDDGTDAGAPFPGIRGLV